MAAQQESQPKPKPQNSDTETFSEKELVEKINALQNPPSPHTKKDHNELNLLKKLHEKGKAVGYTTVKCSLKDLEKLVREKENDRPISPPKEYTDELKWLEDLLEKAKEDGYATVCDGTVFHYGGNWLYTCAHVVRSEDYLKDTTVTLEWRNLDGESKKHTCPPPQGDPNHRIGIFTKITKGGDEIDLAIFRENQINVPLQAIKFESIISTKYDPEVPEHQATPISLREDDTLYQIYWDFPKSDEPPTKMFCITKQSTDKEVDSERKEGEEIGRCFPFNSPALKGASGSPVMVYRNIFEEDSDDDSKQFCLVGVMSEGWRKVQLAQLPESIIQHSNLMRVLNSQFGTLDRAKSLAEHLKDNTTVPAEWMHTLEQQVQQAKESIRDVFQTNDIVGTGQLARSD